jgi:hypothetical protein
MICKYYSMGNCRNAHCQYDHIVVDDESDKYTEETLVRDTSPKRNVPLKVHKLHQPPNPFPKGSKILKVLKTSNPLQKIITYWGLSSTVADSLPMIYSGNFDMDGGHVKSTTEIELLIRFEPCLRAGGEDQF